MARTGVLKPWEDGFFVVIDLDGRDTILGKAQGGAGFEDWLREERDAHAQNRLAHPPDLVLVGVDDALMKWATEMGEQKWEVLVRDNRREVTYRVTAFVSGQDHNRDALTFAADNVKPDPFPA